MAVKVLNIILKVRPASQHSPKRWVYTSDAVKRRTCRHTMRRFAALRWVYTSDGVKRFVALCRAFTRRSKARESVSGVEGLPVYTSHAATSARQRALESVARRQMQQSSTVLNFRASRQRTPAILPIMYRCHELSLQRIELAITSVSSILGNQLVASESQRASDHGQRAVVTPRVKLSLSFLSPFSIYLINFIHIDS